MPLPPPKAPLMAQPGYVQAFMPVVLDEQQCSNSTRSRMEKSRKPTSFEPMQRRPKRATLLDTADSRLLLGNDGKRSFIHPVPQRQLRRTKHTFRPITHSTAKATNRLVELLVDEQIDSRTCLPLGFGQHSNSCGFQALIAQDEYPA